MKKNILLLSCFSLFGLLGSAQNVLNQYCETDGVVNTALKMNNKIYIGGDFSYVGKTTGSLGSYSNANQTVNSLPFSIEGTVNTLVRDGNGKIYIGGNFSYNGAQKNILVLNSDYSLASSPNLTVDGTINLMKLSGDNLVMSGNFSTVNGQPRIGMAAYNINTNTLLAFAPNPDGAVNDFEIAGSNVWMGGTFQFIGGGQRNALAAVSLSNTLQSANYPINGVVKAIEIADSLLFIGGEFDSVAGISRNNLASININLNGVRTWNITTDGMVNAMGIIGSDLYFGGAFYTLNTNNFKIGYASANMFTGVISNMDVAFDAPVERMSVQNGNVHVAGGFSNVGNSERKYFAILSPSGSVLASPTFNNSVKTSLVAAGDIWVGGSFSSFGGTNQRNLAVLDATSGDILPYAIEVDGEVKKIIQAGNQLLIAGSFNNVNLTGRTGVALVDTINGTPDFWDASCNGVVNQMELIGSTLYLAGNFTEIGDSSRSNIASLDLNSSIVSSWNPEVNGAVNKILFMGPYLFIGGEFTQVNNTSRKFIASFNLTNNSLRNWSINLDSNVTSLAQVGDKILVTGIFNTINNLPHSKAFIADTTSANLQTWNPQFLGNPNAAHVEGSIAFLGGDIQSQNNRGLLVYNTLSGAELDFPVKVTEGKVGSLVKFEDKIAMGGTYQITGNGGKRNFSIINFNVNAPTQQTQSVSVSNINAVSARINIGKGNGAKRVVLMKQGSPVDTTPVDGNVYNANANFGDGDNVAGNLYVLNGTDTSVVVNNLNFSTTYHVAVFEFNGFANNTAYNTSNPARANFTTSLAFLPPSTSASNVSFTNTRLVQTTVKWTNGNGEKRLVLIREGSAVNQNPKDSTPYFANSEFGSGSELGTGNFVIYNGTGDSCLITNLKGGTTYHVSVFEYNGTDQLARVKTSSPATGNVTTLAKAAKPVVPTLGLTISAVNTDEITLNWTNGNGSNRIIIASENAPVTSMPVDGDIYFSDNSFNGNSSYLSQNERVVYVGSGSTVKVTGLNQLTRYYFAAFEYNGSSYTSSYLTTNYPTVDTTTRIAANAPIFPSKDIVFTDKGQDYLSLSWTKGSGEKRLVVVKNKLNQGTYPVQGNLYSANSMFGLGDTLGDGSFVVSNGNDSAITVSGLEANTNYYFAIYEYNETAFGGIYLTDSFAYASTKTAVGLKKLKGQSLKIYPNPVNEGLVNIELAHAISQGDRIEMFDIQGKMVKSFQAENWVQFGSNQIMIEVKDLQKGIYTLQYHSSKGKSTIKLNLN